MYERQPKMRLGLASLIAAIAIIAVLVIFIAPQIDLDDMVIRSGQLFLGLLLALIFHHSYRDKRSRNSVDISTGIFWARLGNLFPYSRVLNLLC